MGEIETVDSIQPPPRNQQNADDAALKNSHPYVGLLVRPATVQASRTNSPTYIFIPRGATRRMENCPEK